MSWEISNNTSSYLSSCREAATNENLFNNFKQDNRYRQILEHVSHEESEQYLQELKVPISDVLQYLDFFKENDKYGNPDLFEYDSLGTISPTTIRYIKNTFDICSHFDKNQIKNIVEIGGGYGGLCKVLSSVIDFDNYILFDLQQANELSQKYISKFDDLKDRVQSFTLDQLTEIGGIDLLISNYAFSEVSRDIQDQYYDKVIKKSKNIYMVFNQISNKNILFSDFIDKLSSDGYQTEYYCEHEDSPNCNKILYATCQI
jgi:putative sugar O-methyltransferase